MKMFFIKTVVFCLIVASIFLTISFSYEVDAHKGNTYISAMIDKHKRLETIQDNRLIFVGGSSTAFGISSRKLEEALHFSVTNLGLHVHLGRDFILNEALSIIKPNDVIMLGLEYELYNPAKVPDLALIERAQYLFPESRQYYSSPAMHFDLMLAHFRKSFNFINRWFDREESDAMDRQNRVYARESFNEYGDFSFERSSTIMRSYDLEGNLAQIQSIGDVELFRKLSERCKQVGARVFIIFPPYPRKKYVRDKEAIEKRFLLIKKELPFIPVLGTPDSFLAEDDELFDTIYHLTTPGADRRTDVLISLLKENGIVSEDSAH